MDAYTSCGTINLAATDGRCAGLGQIDCIVSSRNEFSVCDVDDGVLRLVIAVACHCKPSGFYLAACHGEVSTVRHSDAILAVTVRSLSDCTDVAAFHGHGGIFTGYFNQTAIIRSRCIILAGNYLAFLLGRAVLQCHLAQDDDFACCAVVGSQCISVQVKNHGLSGGYTDALPCDVGIGGQFKIFAVGESGL